MSQSTRLVFKFEYHNWLSESLVHLFRRRKGEVRSKGEDCQSHITHPTRNNLSRGNAHHTTIKDVKSWAAAARSGEMRDFCEVTSSHPRRILSVKLDVLPGNTLPPTLSAEHFHTWQPHSVAILYPVKIVRLHLVCLWRHLASQLHIFHTFEGVYLCCWPRRSSGLEEQLPHHCCLLLTLRRNMCFFHSVCTNSEPALFLHCLTLLSYM